MKPEERDQIKQRTPPGMPQPPTPPGQPMRPPTAHPHKPIHIPLISVTTSPKDEGDRAATESLLTQCLDNGVYSCPRCPYTTTDPDEMVEHLAEEMNKSIAALNAIGISDKSGNESAPNPTP